MSDRGAAERIRIIRELLHARYAADFDEIYRHLDHLEREVEGCTCPHRRRCHHRPAHITITDSQKGTTMSSYNTGTTINLTAAVKNDRGANIADTLTWASTAGTVTAGPNSTDDTGAVVMTAILTDVTDPGDVAVTATTSDGLPFTDTITFTDPNAGVPASIVVTDSAAA